MSTKRNRRLAAGMQKAATVAAASLVGVGSLVALSPSPASAHESSIRVGDAVGTVGAAHSGARICELSPTVDARGWMHVILGNGNGAYMQAADGCQTAQFADRGGIVRYRVGWGQGGAVVWSGWKGA